MAPWKQNVLDVVDVMTELEKERIVAGVNARRSWLRTSEL